MDILNVPKRYIPRGLSEKDTKKQKKYCANQEKCIKKENIMNVRK
jgi:hypothetical protein